LDKQQLSVTAVLPSFFLRKPMNGEYNEIFGEKTMFFNGQESKEIFNQTS